MPSPAATGMALLLRRDQVRKLTLADLNRVAAQYLTRDNRSVAIYLPPPTSPNARRRPSVDVAALVKGPPGRRHRRQGRGLRGHAGQPGRAHPALHARQRPESRPHRQSTRGQAVQARLRLHYGDEKSLMNQETVAAAWPSCWTRAAPAHAPADQRPVRQAAGRGRLLGFRTRRSVPASPPRARTCRPSSRSSGPAAEPCLPGRRAGGGAPPVALGHRAPAHRARVAGGQHAAAPRQPTRAATCATPPPSTRWCRT